MSVPVPRSRGVMLLLALVAALVVASALSTAAMAGSRAAVYTQTNDPAGNTVQRFTRAADGSLEPPARSRPEAPASPRSAVARARSR